MNIAAIPRRYRFLWKANHSDTRRTTRLYFFNDQWTTTNVLDRKANETLFAVRHIT